MGLLQASLLSVLLVGIFTLVAYRRLLDRLGPFARREPIDKKPVKDGTTFRVQGVPLDWNCDRLRSFLVDHDNLCAPNIMSLAREVDGLSLTGTIIFQSVPYPLRTGKSWQIRLSDTSKDPSARRVCLVLDDNFLGLTTLFAPAPEDHKVDVVAISGLGGHAFGSFKERGGEHMWLRDGLPHDLTGENTGHPMARLITYGYASGIANSTSMQNLEDLATSFHASLLQLASSPTTRSIIFIAHSLGGLIVKQTLITLSKSKNEEDEKLVRAVYGITFFGVPHDGMDIESLVPMVGDGPNRFLVESINRINSQILSLQRRDFLLALGKEGETEVVCFYETIKSPTAQKDKHGIWTMSGPPAVLVTKSSATICRPWEDGPEHICAVARSHSDLVKFGPQDQEYRNCRERLRGLARRALTVRRRIQGSRTKFLVPYNPNTQYVERSKIMNELKLQFGYDQCPRPARSRSRVALYGLGGTGKTQVALAYVYWLQEVYPDVSVFWVHASNAERFRQSFLHIAQECQIPGHDSLKADLLSLVKFWLGKKGHGRWLMVIDNADDTELFFGRSASAATAMTDHSDGSLAHYIPECAHGRILVTTRNKQAGSRLTKGHQPIEVGRMDEEESYHLLRTRLEDADSTVAALSALTTRLEGLPLALVQATAFIQENCITIDDYLKLLDQGNQSLVDLLSEEFETVGRDSETPRAVAETWMLSFQQISQQNELAGQLLSVMSLFDCQGIPMVFLSHYSGQERNGGPRSELELTKSLGVLKAFCLITEEKSGSLDVHRLVHLVTRKWLQKEGRISQFERDALSTVSNTYPFGCYENRTVCAEYLPHATAVLKVELAGSDDGANEKASLLHCVSGYLDFEGKWKDAEMLLGRGSRMREEVLGKEHPDTLNSMSNLASTYRNQGRWNEAEQLEVGVMETTKRVLGDEHPHTLTCMSNLALTYRNQGRWTEAKQLQVWVMETTKRVLGDEHPSTLTSMNNLASTYSSQGRWREAEKLQVGVMELMSRVLGDEHPSTLTSMSNLASTYSNQGRWAEAEQLEVGVMETTKRVLGDEHPDTLTSMNNLGLSYQDQGRWKEAEQLQEGVMETRKRVLGDEHPDTLTSMSNLASTYSNQGRWAEAEQLEVGVMETTKRVLGDEHPSTLSSMDNLALTYQNQGRWKEAEQLGVRVMDTRKRVLSDEHPSTLTSMANLASTYQYQGRWKEAEQLQAGVMELMKRVLSDEHPHTLSSMSNLASTYSNQGRWAEAEQLQVGVMETTKRVLGDEHPSTLSSMNNLASTYWNQGRWKEAEQLQVGVMELMRRVLGAEHPSTLTSMANLASTYSNQGRWAEAEQLEVGVMETTKRVLGDEHPHTLRSMSNLASTYSNQGRWKEAEQLGVRVMDTRKRVLSDEHPDTLTSMANLASTYSNQGRWKEAEQLEVGVMELMQRVLGDEHSDTLTSMANLAWTLHDLGCYVDAQVLMEHCSRLRRKTLGDNHPHTRSSVMTLTSWQRNVAVAETSVVD